MSRRDMLARDRPRFDRHTALEPYAPQLRHGDGEGGLGTAEMGTQGPGGRELLGPSDAEADVHAGRRTEMMAAAGATTTSS